MKGNQTSYLDLLTEELAKATQDGSVTPGSAQHVSLLSEALVLITPDMGVDARADKAYYAIRQEATETGIWASVLDTAAMALAVQAFGTAGHSA